MHRLPSRRAFVRSVASASFGALAAPARAAQSEPTPREVPLELKAYQFGRQVWVRCNREALTCYRAHPTQKYPYFYPLIGPASGASLTTESGDPYPHHRSIIFACDRVNQGNYWQQGVERGQIVSRGPRIVSAEPGQVVIADACDWLVPGAEPDLSDERRYAIAAPSEGLRFLDADITLTARRDVRVTRTNHSFFAVRVAPDLAVTGGGTLLNSEGHRAEQGTFGQKAAWCDFSASRGDVLEGLALLDHPQNPWSPCRWFTRDYGFMSPTPMQWLPAEGWTLAEDESIRLRYRILVHLGDAVEADVAGLYAAWAAE